VHALHDHADAVEAAVAHHRLGVDDQPRLALGGEDVAGMEVLVQEDALLVGERGEQLDAGAHGAGVDAVVEATGPLARLVRLLAPWLEPLFPADLARRGGSASDPLGPTRGAALAEALDAAARALWSRPYAAFLSSRPGLEIALENTQPPSVVATAAVTELPPAALAFLAARALDLLDHGWALVGKFAPKDVGILLELACRFGGGTPPSLGLPDERAGAFLGMLGAKVPPAAATAAAELAGPASVELAETDPRAFSAGLRRTANRVGLLYSGDPGAALRALALLDRRLEAGLLDPVQALALPDLRDLALFALSDPFLDLRASAVR
jgi:hypothetical protein